jgi:hypothetical protein
MRRYPLLLGFMGLAATIAVYLVTSRPLAQAMSRFWYENVDRRLVEDHHTIVPKEQQRLFGTYRPELPWDYDRFYGMGISLGLMPKIAAWYQAWGIGEGSEFKAEAIEKATGKGLLPLITWEPWLSDFADQSIPESANSLAHVVSGEFDPFIRRWAKSVVRARHPILLRPFHEMGNASYPWSTASGNSPELIAEAWRHVVGVFRDEGATNAAFVWTPYTPEDESAWPGSIWVDWIGLDIFNYGTLAEGGTWAEFHSIVQWQLNAVRQWNKPVLLSEVGCAGFGGNCNDWWVQAFRDLAAGEFPDIKGVVIYDNPAYSTQNQAVTVDWGFTHLPNTLAAVRPWARSAGFELQGR